MSGIRNLTEAEKKANIFYKHRKEISAIGYQYGVNTSVAASMWAVQHKVNDPAAMTDWYNICRQYIRAKDKTLGDLFRE